MTASTNVVNGAGNEDADYQDHLIPLVKVKTIRLTAPMYARLAVRALCEGKSEGAIVRRWLVKGALAEGIELNKPL